MSNDEIKQLVQLVIDSGIAEIEVQRGQDRVRIRRTPGGPGGGRNTEIAVPMSAAPEAAHVSAAAAGAGNEITVKSPIVGTYYDAAKPGEPPFVRVGDSVEPGQVLCIIESMKLMNEIEAEVAGIVVHKLMENARPVEYGEALFVVRPR
ncbi:MAG TPA: acetyl-CoA carboxylase biotin carboxyl carrier protein [Bryobacteraceae bacterium]|nr:acetyl-CoA carboxylase biotin carboxyl carrier protein [Bryobacteraceae bacterium]